MTARISLSLITIVTLFATCLEGRYHLDATGLRHHRHDRHHQAWNQDLVPRGSRRRDWEESNDAGETAIDRLHKDRAGVASGRRIPERNIPQGHDRRGSSGATHRGRYEPQRPRGRGRNEGRHPRRDYYHVNSASSWGAKGRREDNRHVTSSSGRGERPWTYRNPSRYDRRRDDELEGYGKVDERRRGRYDDDDDDDGYEADDEEYYPSRKGTNPYEAHSKGRRNRHESNDNWHDEWRRRVDDAQDDEDEDYDDDYDQDYEEYDDQETEKRPSRKRHGKRTDDFDDFGFEKKKEGQNEVPGGRRGGRKKDRVAFNADKQSREKPEDLNEVEEDDDEIWGDSESDDDDGSLDEYDETGTSDFDINDPRGKLGWKTIDDVIRGLTAGDLSTTTSTPKPNPRREYRNIENDKHPVKDRHGNSNEAKNSPKVQAHSSAHKKSESALETSTTTTTRPSTMITTQPKLHAKITNDLLNRVTNSSRNEVGTVMINAKTTRVKTGRTIDSNKHLVSQITRTDPDSKTKSLEQDYEEYENDGSDDKLAEDVDDLDADVDADGDAENDKKLQSEKDRDYNEEEDAKGNEAEIEKPAVSTTATILPLTTTSTTTTTTTTTPSPIFTRTFDHRRSRVLDPRSRANSLKNFQTTSTSYPPMSNYSAHKWRTLGNRKFVNERRNTGREMGIAEIEIMKAIDHAQQMNKETLCRWPRPRVISVREVYPSPSKSYNPSCTMLHRCADDTGCCSPEDTCVPKHLHSVELSFYATALGGSRFVEKLRFENHTECQCRPRTPPLPPPPPPTTMKPCKCPSLFIPKNTPQRGCHCDCRDNHLPCLRQRRGKDHFSTADQWCIKTEQCALPPCEFGDYLRMPGRCPLRIELFNRVTPNNSNVKHRNY